MALLTGPTPDVVQAVIWRDGARCVRCAEFVVGERGYRWSLHHRRGRDGRPDSHQTQNLIVVCGGDNVTGCHGAIHGGRREAERQGWWLSRIAGTDPLLVPVWVERLGGPRFLTSDGEYADEPEGAECASS